tara:strand:- start:730 stop:1002 length:273 start_codon:yes stop_codon:yes gene_type:complete
MKQLELFEEKDYVLFGLSFEMPEPGCFAWYKESDEDYLNPRKGYCYIQNLSDDFNFICYDAENDRHLVLRHHEITRVDELRKMNVTKEDK